MTSLITSGSNLPYVPGPTNPTTTGTTSTTSDPSVIITAGTPGFEAFLNVSNSGQLLGLSKPLSASDIAALLAQVASALRLTLTQDQVDSIADNADSENAQITAMKTLLSQIASSQAAQAAAQTRAENDQSQIDQNDYQIGSDQIEINANQSTIVRDQQLISDEPTGDLTDGAILQSQINDLTADNQGYATDIAQLAGENASLSADINAQNQIVTASQGTETSDAAALTVDLNNLENLPGVDTGLLGAAEAAIGNLTSDIDSLDQAPIDQLKGNLQAATLAQSALIALQAVFSLGALNPQAGGGSPQNATPASTV